MSLNQSINRIAPYVVTPSPTETGAPPFSPSFVKAKDQSYQHKEDDGTSMNQKGEGENVESKVESFSEIFKVVDSPDFTGLFLLATGKDDSQLMLVIKKVREQRGVTDLIPVSDAKKEQKANYQEYLETNRHFLESKREQFTGKL